MRPPSYYTSLANSNSSSYNNRSSSNSSQQLRSSFSSSSSTSYATRTHLPFVPHTMLVAHCYTGVGSTTKPYGQSSGSSSLYSSTSSGGGGRSGIGSTASSYSSSTYSSRPSSTKRNHYSPSSSSSSTFSSYTPRSTYISTSSSTTNSYPRRPSAYTYQPVRLRERPLLTRISNPYSHQRYTTTTTTESKLPPSGRDLAPTSTAATTASTAALASQEGDHQQDRPSKKQQSGKEAEEDWSSDITRNISRNKYLIKFREFDKSSSHRASIVPDRETFGSGESPQTLSKEEVSKAEFKTREGPNISVTVKLPSAKSSEDNHNDDDKEKQEVDMRVPLVENQSTNQLTDDLISDANKSCEKTIITTDTQPVVVVGKQEQQQLQSAEQEECDKKAILVAQKPEVPTIEAKKAPKERRNIKLKKINNVKAMKQANDQVPIATVDTTVDDSKQSGIATASDEKAEKTQETPTTHATPTIPTTPTTPTTPATTTTPAATTTKSKVVKRIVKSKVAATPDSSSNQEVDNNTNNKNGKSKPKTSELKAKDSLLIQKKVSDRKVLSPKQLVNLSQSKENSPAEKPPTITNDEQQGTHFKTSNSSSSNNSLSSPKDLSDLSPVQTNKRIRFREYNHEDFNFLSVLGHGGWGFVILAELKNHESACFAVKCIKKITIVEDDDFDSIMIERKVLTLGNIHPFICKLFCTFETEGYLFFAMEYCAGGDLMFHVQREEKFNESRSRFYAAEIICAIKFLHNQHIIYRDLKLDNILLDSRGHIRLVDFGMCQCRTYREEMLPSNFCGTPEYISPEIIKGVPYNHSVDWWSFGVLLYEMAVGKMPFRGNDENELLWNVCYEQIHYPMFLTKELTSLLQSLLEREPTKRMGMSTCKAGDIYDQAWFKGVDWRAIEELRVPPPFVPDVTSDRDVQNFDSDFTQSTPELSPVDEGTLKKIDQSQFQKFPYTNPNISIFG